MTPGKRIWVLPVRQQKHPHVQSLFQHEIDSPQRGLDPGSIPVINNCHVWGQSTNQPDLFDRQRGSRGSHHVLNSFRMKRDDVRVPFHQDTAILLHDRFLGKEYPVKGLTLVIYLRFRGIQVF